MRLKEAREHAGLTGYRLALLAESTPPQIYRYESGKTAPKAETAARLAAVLGVRLEDVDELAHLVGGADGARFGSGGVLRYRFYTEEEFRAAVAAEVNRQMAELAFGSAAQREARPDR